MNQYEAMFLFDPTFGASLENCDAEIQRLMERAGAELVVSGKWDERRLAYRIKGRKRGVYVLTYFKAPSDKIGQIERDVQLSENILRVLIVRTGELSREAMDRGIAGAHTTVDDDDDGYSRSPRRDDRRRPAAPPKDAVVAGRDESSGSAKVADPA